TIKPKGYVQEIYRNISPTFATVYLVAYYLAIGPFFAIPRTATTSLEIGIAPLLCDANLGIWLFGFTDLYFLAAYLIS
ncbi:branched-chain amino acid transport system II carrier protein, partial [Streptococcus suis]